MDDIIKIVETFLSYSDDKLEELKQKNQELKENQKHDDDLK